MKPRIFKTQGKWAVWYPYTVRSFWVFGMNRREREEVAARCHATEFRDTFDEAVELMRDLYRQNMIARVGQRRG